MIASINGMVCACNREGAKDKDGNFIPVTDLYSGGEVVKVKGLETTDSHVGSYVDIPCKIQLKDWEGRKYISVEAIPNKK